MGAPNVCRMNQVGREMVRRESGFGSAGFLVVVAGVRDAQGSAWQLEDAS